jgi:hypothetical protein
LNPEKKPLFKNHKINPYRHPKEFQSALHLENK